MEEVASFWPYKMYAKIFTCQEPLNTDVGEVKVATGSQERFGVIEDQSTVNSW